MELEYPLTESEHSLIESGVVTFAEVLEGRKRADDAKRQENEETAAARRWDETHCPICGADTREEPNHCR